MFHLLKNSTCFQKMSKYFYYSSPQLPQVKSMCKYNKQEDKYELTFFWHYILIYLHMCRYVSCVRAVSACQFHGYVTAISKTLLLYLFFINFGSRAKKYHKKKDGKPKASCVLLLSMFFFVRLVFSLFLHRCIK